MRRYLIAEMLVVGLTILLGCAFLWTPVRAGLVQRGIAGKILRFHVLANSDSAEDQALKLKVRDAVGAYLSGELKDADSLAESEAIVTEHLTEIEAIGERIVQAEGYAYTVTASLENSVFPEKTYGAYTFPSGRYEALRIVIGEGGGHNWWCVLYPNLCFAGSVYKVDEDSGERLKTELTNAEYAALLESGDCKTEFKILKFLNER